MSINSCHQINLEKLFLELSQVFDGDTEIEKIASQELLQKAKVALAFTEEKAISEDIANVMR